MRIVLAGQKSFGTAVLERLCAHGLDVALVVGRPGDRLYNTARYEYRIEVADRMRHEQIADLEPDLIVCAHSFDFVGRKSRAAAKLGAIVGHPSLLPRHRGRDAVEWTVRFRDPIAGFTWFQADDGVDTGPIIHQDWCHVSPKWDASALWRHGLFPIGVRTVSEAIAKRGQGLGQYEQDPRFATWEPSLEAAHLHRSELPELPSAG